MKKKLFILCILSVFYLVGCSRSSNNLPDRTLESVQAYYEEYMETKKTENSADKLLSYLYFENEWESEAYAATAGINPLVFYEILSTTQLNDNLWVLQIIALTKADQEEGREGEPFYNFVGIVDGEYRVMTHIRNIPEEIAGDIDLELYTNDNASTVQPDELIEIEIQEAE